jgi:beta-glucosidase
VLFRSVSGIAHAGGALALWSLFSLSPCLGQAAGSGGNAGAAAGPPTTTRKTLSPAEIERKIDALLSQMTVDEKMGQLSQPFHFSKKKVDAAIAAGMVGSVDHVFDPTEINALQRLAVETTRLHIPLLFNMDVIHGYRVIFPVPIGLASSWDMAMIERVQSIAAMEARAGGQQWTSAPMLDIARDPRWGRIVEGAGEDPYLGAKVAVAQIKGFQGDLPIDTNHLIATVKHFAGYGTGEGGRDHDAANLSESQLHNVILPPFKAAVEAGAATVMSAYTDLNDVPATGNPWLLTDVLRDQWKFKGLVISDNNAVNDLVPHGFARDKEDAARRALDAGVDVEMTSYGDVDGLFSAGHDGTLDMEKLNSAVRRVLRLKFQLDLFDHPYVEVKPVDALVLEQHLNAARVAADRSAVLLRNDGNVLPLRSQEHKKLAVIGQLADSRQDTLGPWTGGENIDETVTVRQALEQSGKFTSVVYAQGIQISRKYPSPFDGLMKEKPQKRWTPEQTDDEFRHAIEVARDADIVVAVMGELQDMSGESASRASLDLPGRQEELLKAISALGKPVVLILFNGRPLNLQWEVDHIPGIIEMWYPGTEGGNAAVDLLFGEENPGGKLPFTWPRDADQIPTYYSHNNTQDPQDQGRRYWDEPSVPLLPFGHGLSYTKFSFGTPKVVQPEVKMGQPLTIESEVENAGDVAGDVVAQLYIHQRFGSASRPVRELKGFDRVALQPHEKKVVRFALSPEDLSFWSTAKKRWTQEPATFDYWVGEDSTAKSGGTFIVNP